MTKKRAIIIIIILLIVGAAGWWYQNREAPEREVLPHQIIEVEKGELSTTISSTGYLEPEREKEHQPEQGGEIKKIYVESGDRVHENEILYQLDDIEQRLEYIQARNRLQQARINGTEREIEEQEVRLEMAKKRLEDRKIRSRLNGIVGDFELEEGDFVTSEMSSIIVRDETSYLVKIELDEIDVPLVEEGMETQIEVDALRKNIYQGEVKLLELGTTRNNGVVVVPGKIAIDNSDERFRSGYSADVDIIIESREDILLVPATAIYEEEEQNYVVKVDEENQPQLTPVSTGLSDNIEVEITSGLNKNDRVLINVHQYSEFGEPDWQFGPGAGPPPGTPGAQNGGNSP